MTPFQLLNDEIVTCRQCPRLVEHREEMARVKRAAFREAEYWGRPIPNFGDPAARLLIVGLAPAAHGGNRTGRMFTGDRSGDWLFRALHQTGFANQAESVGRGDGLQLLDAMITAVNHCVPPLNKLQPSEIAACRPFMERTLDMSPNVRVVVALGKVAYDASCREFRRRGWADRCAAFSHGAETQTSGPWLLAAYHPSQQNTFTGKLTEEMLRAVFDRARTLARR